MNIAKLFGLFAIYFTIACMTSSPVCHERQNKKQTPVSTC